MFKCLVSIFIVISLFVGCGQQPPKIDTSTDEALKKSTQEVRQSLSKQEQQKFDEALQSILMNSIDLRSMFSGNTEVAEAQAQAKLKNSIDGLTGVEVIAKAETILKERKIQEEKLAAERTKREREKALAKIKELEEKKVQAEKAKIELSKFSIIKSRFYKRKVKYVGEDPVIELTVKNGTNHSVSRVCFNAILISPGRSIPWVEDKFCYKISGGLEPGEKASWSLAPNPFSKWGTAKPSSDAILTLEAIRLEGPKGKLLFSSQNFSSRDAERLNALKKKYLKK